VEPRNEEGQHRNSVRLLRQKGRADVACPDAGVLADRWERLPARRASVFVAAPVVSIGRGRLSIRCRAAADVMTRVNRGTGGPLRCDTVGSARHAADDLADRLAADDESEREWHQAARLPEHEKGAAQRPRRWNEVSHREYQGPNITMVAGLSNQCPMPSMSNAQCRIRSLCIETCSVLRTSTSPPAESAGARRPQ
jgi:hypothetical protein